MAGIRRGREKVALSQPLITYASEYSLMEEASSFRTSLAHESIALKFPFAHQRSFPLSLENDTVAIQT